MDSTYTPLIDSLIRIGEGKVRSSRIVKQLESFLNITFEKSVKHDLKRLSDSRIEQYHKNSKRQEELRMLATAKRSESMHFLVGNKLKTKAWLELLYTQNLGVGTQESIPTADEIPVLPGTKVEDDASFDIAAMATLYRNNITLLYRLDHDLNPYFVAPQKDLFRARRQLEARRKKSRMKHSTFENSIQTTQLSASQHLYTWSANIQKLLKIEHPLSMNEVIYLVFRYAREKKLYSQSLFHSNDLTSFFSSHGEPLDSKTLFQRVISNKLQRVGYITQNGTRYTSSDGSADCHIPTDAYNIPEVLLQRHFAAVCALTDVQSSFPTLFKSNASRSSHR